MSGTTAPGPGGSKRDGLLAEIARAYYERDLTQAQIGVLHGLSRSQVSRYLQAARDEGIVQIRIVPRDDRDGAAEQALRRAFPHLQEVVVVRVFATGGSLARRAVALAAGELFDRLIRPGMSVCIGAGRTMALAASAMTERRLAGLVMVPATGNAGHAALDSDYSAVTQAFADRLGGIAHRINAPAITGAGSNAADLTRSNPQVEHAIELGRQADLFLLGLGSLGGDEIFVDCGTISDAELHAVRRAGAVGDLCGDFFDADGQLVREPFRDRLVGVTIDDLRRAPLVVAIAGGEEKSAAILGALRGRLIGGLVTDEHAAQRVLAGLADDRHRRVAGRSAQLASNDHQSGRET